MKLLNLIKGDIIIQYKYGFYYILLIFSFIYIITIKVVPADIQSTLSAILVFTDPTALGLIFMGAIIHFEISEKTINSIYISPISPFEYLLSKLLSVALLSTLMGILIGIFTGTVENYFSFIFGIYIGSLVFSALGVYLAFQTKSMNQFILSVIPSLIFIVLPGVAYIIGLKSVWLILHPGIAITELIINGDNTIMAMCSLLIWICITILLALRIVNRRFKHESGEVL
jgi:fluoroquinolone transport system permease protein